MFNFRRMCLYLVCDKNVCRHRQCGAAYIFASHQKFWFHNSISFFFCTNKCHIYLKSNDSNWHIVCSMRANKKLTWINPWSVTANLICCWLYMKRRIHMDSYMRTLHRFVHIKWQIVTNPLAYWLVSIGKTIRLDCFILNLNPIYYMISALLKL